VTLGENLQKKMLLYETFVIRVCNNCCRLFGDRLVLCYSSFANKRDRVSLPVVETSTTAYKILLQLVR